MPQIGPVTYGTTFPTTGLYNGYQFVLNQTDVGGGTIANNFIYRVDLNASYPWHAVSPSPLVLINSADWSGSVTYPTDYSSTTLSRAGDWFFELSNVAGTNDTHFVGTLFRMMVNGVAGRDLEALINFGTNGHWPLSRLETIRKTSLPSNFVVKVQVGVNGASNGTITGITLKAYPYRLI